MPPTKGYDRHTFYKAGFYDGYVKGKKKPRHSVGSWQSFHYEAGYSEGKAKRDAEERLPKQRA